jgi:dipeptidyl aminopeptidase/acylaminoacyl peptidase
MLKAALSVALSIGLLAAAAFPAAAQPYPLIPRKTLLGNPERASPLVSPDGKSVAFLAPFAGVMNVFVGPIGDIASAKALTASKARPIQKFKWAFDGKHILFLQDGDGDENYAVFAANIETGNTRKLIGGGKSRAEILGGSYGRPDEVLVGLNDRDPKWLDVWRVNVATGEAKRIEKNDGMDYFLADGDLNLRAAVKSTADGGTIVLRRKGADWTPLFPISPDDAMTTYPQAVSADGAALWMIDSRNRDKAVLARIDLASGAATIAGKDNQADVVNLIFDPQSNNALAYGAEYERQVWRPADISVAPDIAFLNKNIRGVWDVLSQSKNNDVWTIRIDAVNEPVKFAAYNRGRIALSQLFVARPSLISAPLSPMGSHTIVARDGLRLVSYLTLPKGSDPDGDGKPQSPLPMVLTVHGGPWWRDSYGYDPTHQWLANRGYAVLSVNFRGSTGFGKAFLNAGDREWAGKMHDDLIDAVGWAVKRKIAHPGKVAIFGGSYGGYAALVGLSFTPKTFACGVSIVGPSNLNTFLASTPAYWASILDKLKRRIGDHTTPEGRKQLTGRSPLFRASAIERPLLIVHGANDPRVKQSESDQIADAMKRQNVPVSYVLYADEGHGLARPENRLSFFAVAESFLGKCLGGRVEPIAGDFKGSSIAVIAGREFLPGAGEALGMTKPN